MPAYSPTHPVAAPFIDPCARGHAGVKRPDGWVYCARCGKRLYKG